VVAAALSAAITLPVRADTIPSRAASLPVDCADDRGLAPRMRAGCTRCILQMHKDAQRAYALRVYETGYPGRAASGGAAHADEAHQHTGTYWASRRRRHMGRLFPRAVRPTLADCTIGLFRGGPVLHSKRIRSQPRPPSDAMGLDPLPDFPSHPLRSDISDALGGTCVSGTRVGYLP
jgi:hypothetical protein